ncbi:MAG: CBS domain-containing protein [Clostridia bacterium]|nr:CBS domain-containing protein [Clostridia bacterium]
MTNAELFLEKYKQLEEAVRTAYNLRNEDSVSFYLTNHNKYRDYVDEIKYCKEVRNLLSHKKKISNSFAVEPNDNMISFIDELIEKVKNRRKCCEIQVKLSDVYWQRCDSLVKDCVEVMHKTGYGHVPILDNKGSVAGVFGINSLFSYIADNGASALNENLKFSDILEYLALDTRKSRKIIFVKADLYADELEKQIEKAFKKGERIVLALVTQNGDPKGKLQGIITPWEIINL